MRTDRAAVDKSVLHRALATAEGTALTEKQTRFVEAFTTHPGETIQAAAKRAGYHGTSLSARPYMELRKSKIRRAIATAFKKLGMTAEYWAWRMKDASQATTLVWLGGQRVEVPDHKQRLAATRLALELRGAFDPLTVRRGDRERGSAVTVNLGFKSSWQLAPAAERVLPGRSGPPAEPVQVAGPGGAPPP